MQTTGEAETFRTLDIRNDDRRHPEGLERAALNVMERLTPSLTITATWDDGYEFRYQFIRAKAGLGTLSVSDPETLDRVAGVLRGVRRQARARDGRSSTVAG